jgi:nitroimidazol reductase NimA-like FMN-containing flavoprotein (pyridoxamine 5'-phosphate oxidase superfamily)
MRENPLICVEADEVRGHDDWASVVILGQNVEIPNAREYAKSREHVRYLLQ